MLLLGLIYFATLSLNASIKKSDKLRFKDGVFNIVQFTDTHIDFTSYNHEHEVCLWSDSAYQQLQDLLNKIKQDAPGKRIDLVVLSGDIVTQMPGYAGPPSKGKKMPENLSWSEDFQQLKNIWTGKGYNKGLAHLFVKNNIPWTFTMGNHDLERHYTKKNNEEYFQFLSTLPNSLVAESKNSKNKVLKTSGNYFIPIYNNNAEKENGLYFINSWDNGLASIPKTHGKSITTWFEEESSKNKVPSFMFMHIPNMWEDNKPVYHAVGSELVGIPSNSWTYQNDVSPGKGDSGLYNAIVNSGNVLAVFCGHDHFNSFGGYSTKGILICYGVKTLNNWWGGYGNGARLITIEQGKDVIKTSKFYYMSPNKIGQIDNIAYYLKSKKFSLLPTNGGDELYWANKFFKKYIVGYVKGETFKKGNTVSSISLSFTNNSNTAITIEDKDLESSGLCTKPLILKSKDKINLKYNRIKEPKIFTLTIKNNDMIIGDLQFNISNDILKFAKNIDYKINVFRPNGDKIKRYDYGWSKFKEGFNVQVYNAEIKNDTGYAEIVINKK